MHPFAINGQSYLLDVLRQDLTATDSIAWLQSQKLYPKVYWKERDCSTVHAAVGSLISFTDVPHFDGISDFDLRLYGGVSFHNDGKTWEGFPPTSFWLPQMEMIQECNRTQLLHYGLNERACTKALMQQEIGLLSHPNSLLNRNEIPCFEQWEKNVNTVLKSISSGTLDKLVLARKTTLEFASPLSPWTTLQALSEKSVHTTLFAFEFSPHLCFLGATPEKLFEREKNLLTTDAVAATRPRGQTTEEDLKWEKDLLTSIKEQKEFKIVKDYLENILAPLAQDLKWNGEDRILKNSHVQHLHNRLNATLKNSISDAQLIASLHPTPALGGFPRQRALKLLRGVEPFERGWYGAPIGVIGQNRTSLYVGIRSALIQHKRAHLFAGTGLVAESDAKLEWDELEHKIRPFTELFL
jgi:menaquinone-specific isochorismate synthase